MARGRSAARQASTPGSRACANVTLPGCRRTRVDWNLSVEAYVRLSALMSRPAMEIILDPRGVRSTPLPRAPARDPARGTDGPRVRGGVAQRPVVHRPIAPSGAPGRAPRRRWACGRRHAREGRQVAPRGSTAGPPAHRGPRESPRRRARDGPSAMALLRPAGDGRRRPRARRAKRRDDEIRHGRRAPGVIA